LPSYDFLFVDKNILADIISYIFRYGTYTVPRKSDTVEDFSITRADFH